MISVPLLMALTSFAPAVGTPLSIDAPKPTSVEVCIADYESKLKKGDVALGISVPEATRLTHEIVAEVGASNQPTVAPCGAIEDAQAFVETENREWSNGMTVPAGEYVLYNPRWTHQVLGEHDDLAVIVLGHEIGHLLNRDFSTTRISTSTLEREKEADRFAGCAAARRAIPWTKVAGILSRLREDYTSDHPKRADSLSEAQAGYNSCLIALPRQIALNGEPAQSVVLQDQPPQARSIDWNAEKILVRELSVLSQNVKSSVVFETNGVNETFGLAQQLMEIFARSGLKARIDSRQTESPAETGLIILRWTDSDPKLTEDLRTALAKAGLVSHFVMQSGSCPYGSQSLLLWVAPQPM